MAIRSFQFHSCALLLVQQTHSCPAQQCLMLLWTHVHTEISPCKRIIDFLPHFNTISHTTSREISCKFDLCRADVLRGSQTNWTDKQHDAGICLQLFPRFCMLSEVVSYVRTACFCLHSIHSIVQRTVD